MVGQIIGSAIGGIAQAVTQGATHKHEKALNERSIAAQKEAAAYEWTQNREQWDRANQYNAPTEQMARLREAGLNPAMIYGSGGAKTAAVQSPKYQAVRPTYNYSPPADPTSMLSAYNDFRMNNAQVDLVRAQAETARAEANNAAMFYSGKAGKSDADSQISYSKADYMGSVDTTPWAKKSLWSKKNITDLQSKQLQNEMLGKQIAGQASRNSILDLDLENYYWNNIGSKVLPGLMRTLPFNKARAGLKGIANKFPKTKATSWMKNDIFKNYKSKYF